MIVNMLAHLPSEIVNFSSKQKKKMRCSRCLFGLVCKHSWMCDLLFSCSRTIGSMVSIFWRKKNCMCFCWNQTLLIKCLRRKSNHMGQYSQAFDHCAVRSLFPSMLVSSFVRSPIFSPGVFLLLLLFLVQVQPNAHSNCSFCAYLNLICHLITRSLWRIWNVWSAFVHICALFCFCFA